MHEAGLQSRIGREGFPKVESGQGAVESVSGLSVKELGNPDALRKSVFKLTDVAVATVDAGANGGHGGQQLYTFPEGHIKIIAAHMNLTVTSTGAVDGIAADATSEIGVGTDEVANDNAALTTTEDNVVAGDSADFVASTRDIGAADDNGPLLDGSTTPIELWLNAAVAEDDHGANAGELTYNGEITVIWTKVGDND